VVDAATRLFVDHGYVATTIENVAEDAGVAAQTVYYVFGTKRNLLAAVLDASIAGDVELIPVLERVWTDELREEPDMAAAVQRLVDESVSILVRTAPVYEVVRRAAADPEVAALLDDTRKRRRADQRALIGIVLQSGHPEPTLDADAAADIFYGLVNEEVFQLIVGDCGWSVARFRNWGTSLMLHQLCDSTRARDTDPSQSRSSPDPS
jgi:AcrR family transcriptional regulator